MISLNKFHRVMMLIKSSINGDNLELPFLPTSTFDQFVFYKTNEYVFAFSCCTENDVFL